MGPMQQSEDVIWTDARRSSEIHDLRNLLQVAVSAVSTSRRRIGGPEAELETALDLASAALEKASVFATRLFMPAHVRETPSLPSRVVLRDLEPLIRHAIGDRIALRLSVAPDAPPLSCDQQAFENALLNLVVNARDAMPGGGVLHIGCCACRRCPARTGLLPHQSERHRTRNAGRGRGQGVRAALHHQGRGRLRPRPAQRQNLRAPERRFRRTRKQAWRRNRGPPPPAPKSGRRRGFTRPLTWDRRRRWADCRSFSQSRSRLERPRPAPARTSVPNDGVRPCSKP